MTTPGSQNILVAENIKKNYGQLQAVAGVSLALKAGECLALLGPNGAGKTTTCEILEGLIVPDSGDVSVNGLNYKANRREILQGIGVQLQETSLYKKYTVRETLELFASFYRKPVDIVPLINSLQLNDKMNARLEHLSGGQKQRVYLGCSLVNDPRLLFLDEPTTGLDPQARRYIWDLLKSFRSDDRSILLTTHHMEEARELADRIAIMDHGKIIAAGSFEELIRNHCPEERLSFTMEPSQIDALMAKLTWLPSERPSGGRIEVLVKDAASKTQELMRISDQLGFVPESFMIRQPTLEDVFLKLTGRSLRDD